MGLNIKINNNQEINPNVFADTSIVPSGTNNAVNVLRTNNAQNMTGSTEGYSSQLTQISPTTNSGTGASIISNINGKSPKNTYTYRFATVFSSGPPKTVTKSLTVVDQKGNISYNKTQTTDSLLSETLELSMYNDAKNKLQDNQ